MLIYPGADAANLRFSMRKLEELVMVATMTTRESSAGFFGSKLITTLKPPLSKTLTGAKMRGEDDEGGPVGRGGDEEEEEI